MATSPRTILTPFAIPEPSREHQLAYADKPFLINDRVIRTDSAGRFCLNDLHKEAGGRSKHQPAFWARLESTEELVQAWQDAQSLKSADLQTLELTPEALANPVTVVHGRNGGTFAVKELVYDYAMWISPEFKLIVIRVFDRLVERGLLDNGMPDLFGANKPMQAHPAPAPLAPAPQSQPQPLVVPAANPSLKLAGDLLGLLLATRDSIPSALVARYLEEAKR